MADTAMDYEVVQGFANKFETISKNFERVSKVLQAAILILKASAFIGSFGSAALIRYLEGIKPRIDTLAKTTDEMGGDLKLAIAERKEADDAMVGHVA